MADIAFCACTARPPCAPGAAVMCVAEKSFGDDGAPQAGVGVAVAERETGPGAEGDTLSGGVGGENLKNEKPKKEEGNEAYQKFPGH